MTRLVVGLLFAAACWGESQPDCIEKRDQAGIGEGQEWVKDQACESGARWTSAVERKASAEAIRATADLGSSRMRMAERYYPGPLPAPGMGMLFAAQAATETPSICGTLKEPYSENIDVLHIACVDYEALRKVAPEVPWPEGTRTQVLLHVRKGEAVRVTVGGVTKFADILEDRAYNRRIAMLQFDGVNHESVDIKVLTEVK